MAENKRHIDLELKAKLGAHEVPVMESDWTSFETFRNNKDKKRRRIIYLFAAALVFIAMSGMLVWKFQFTNSKLQAPNSRIENDSRHPEQAKGTPNPNNRHPEQADGTSGEAEPSRRVEGPHRTEGSRIENESRHPEQANGTPNPNNRHLEQADGTSGEAEPSRRVEGPRRVEGLSPESIPFFSFHLVPPALNQAEIPVVTAYKPSKDDDSSKTLPGPKGKKFPPLNTPSLAFGLAYGFGNPALTVGNNDTTQTHRRYEQTIKGAKQNSQVFRIFLQYEYRLKFGMEFGAGLQFSSQTQVQQYDFVMREIPYMDTNGNIMFYIPIPPSQTVAPTVFESRQQMFSASVPLSFGYAHTLGKNLRLGARAQGSLGMNWSKDFIGLSPKTLTQTEVSANVNPLNLSYGGGLFGEYFYLSKWSARLSLDWTAQNKQFKASNGYNITNRYYEFKLALVRYL